jgi:nitrite reductase/ring-hydroxylating ferredoxin subunit/uncharacterized membrane protein
MRSTASFKGHPIHPGLIPFPFAFLTGAFLSDAAGWLFQVPELTTTSWHLTIAGIAFGLLAAVPGIIDYVNTVPPKSSGKKRARLHGMLNVTALVLFGVSLLLRGEEPSLLPIGLKAAGAGILVYAGWLGGTLVNRNMIGVDHRYANTGRWKEATLEPKSGWVIAAGEDELEPGHMKLLRVNGERIALGRTSRGYCAFQDRCTHRGASLAGGVLVGDTVHCLWHGSQFDAETGAVKCGPAEEPIRRYETEIRNGEVRVKVG